MTTYITIASSLLLIIVFSYLKNKRAKSKVIHVIDDNCTGCLRCLKKCRHKALEIVSSNTGQHIALKDPERCTACSDCIVACKFNALELVSREQTK